MIRRSISLCLTLAAAMSVSPAQAAAAGYAIETSATPAPSLLALPLDLPAFTPLALPTALKQSSLPSIIPSVPASEPLPLAVVRPVKTIRARRAAARVSNAVKQVGTQSSQKEPEKASAQAAALFDQGIQDKTQAQPVAASSEIHPERTAPARTKPSVPTRLAEPLLSGEILDYGAGLGKDTEYLKAKGLRVSAYDPFYFPKKPAQKKRFDWVLLNYVLNVIVSPADRVQVLKDIRGRLTPGGRLLVAVRGEKKLASSRKKYWRPEGDGWVTSRKTFQKGYTQEELKERLAESGFKVVSVLDQFIMVAEKAPLHKPVFGKHTQEAVYFHRSWEAQAPARIKALVDQAKPLLPADARWNLIKVDNHGGYVSFLWYPDFDSDPHPALRYVYRADLAAGKLIVSDHGKRANPFILHRKDSMVSPDHPLYQEFKRLTEKEEAAGLLSRNDIGTRSGWEKALARQRQD
ncbi:MAG: methyltransferase domain-containing protein [Elusimicrobiota bacterium]|jgi:SAM-dependent methyltransferase